MWHRMQSLTPNSQAVLSPYTEAYIHLPASLLMSTRLGAGSPNAKLRCKVETIPRMQMKRRCWKKAGPVLRDRKALMGGMRHLS